MKRQALALVAVVTLAACDVSPDQEAAIGEENARGINAQVPIVTDPAINIGGSAVIAKHSRHDELQADSEAVENVARVGIDPEGIPPEETSSRPELITPIAPSRMDLPGAVEARG